MIRNVPRCAPAALAALAALAACTPKFDPASSVRELRVLAVRAEPPEIAPPGDPSAPGTAALDTLVALPAFVVDPSPQVVVLHLACTPDPGNPTSTACVQFQTLSDPAQLLGGVDPASACAAPGTGKRGAISFGGVEACGLAGCGPVTVRRDPADPASDVTLPAPRYLLPADFSFDAYPASAPERVLGLEADDLALAVQATPAELAPLAAAADACATLAAAGARFETLWSSRPHVVSLKRIQIRGPAAPSPPNHNPAVSGITLGGAALTPPGGSPARIAPGKVADLLPVLPGDFAALRETYVRSDSSGAPIETRQEDWSFSWFATAGDIDLLHTTDPSEADAYTAPASGRVLLWSVVRDLRGGVAWTVADAEAAP
ncbi:hypothetical protein [Anaeromyxobacter oryzae]|uniref:Lipoprotein n=1 Tax=Anaeromyxobacter oryzae TaxID=2918170 RepID=A0ABN6MNX1_9BACT|nr:hypothetical protein [Anaeromyxobacter oryzae]BDG01582.1 hypothetical protein AMOR_05780 [Anaeromyxobacter oryzae]